MNGKSSDSVTPLMISAMRMACSSLSITHGPAMRNRSPEPMWTSATWKEVFSDRSIKQIPPRNHGGTEAQRKAIFVLLCVSVSPWWILILPLALSNFLRPMEHFHLGRLFLRAPFQSVLIRCAHERAEQRVRLQRLRFEFRMKLARNEIRMVGQLDHFHIRSIRGRP